MKQTFDKLCRICGYFDSQLIPIFTDDGLEHNLAGKIKKHLSPIDLHRTDKLPQQVCYQCVSSLVLWSDLYELSMKINKNFKNELKKIEKKNTVTASDTETASADLSHDEGSGDESRLASNETNDKVLEFNKITLLDDNMTAKMFEEINDFDSFLNHSPASSISVDSDVEHVDILPDVNLDQNDHITECIIEPLNAIPENSSPPSTSPPVADSADPKADSTTKPKRRRFRKNPLRSRICHICGKVFKGPDTMRLHVKTVHSGERPHVCPTCNTAFKRRDHLVCHIRYKHENVSYPKRVRTEGGGGRQKRLCGHCGKLLSSSQLLKEHVNSIHTGHQPYKCEKCDISFSRYSNLYHHAVVRDHKVSTFSKACDICGLDFQSETFYLRHMWKHPENVFCEKCQMKFNNNEDFKQHVESVHEELKPLQCDTCGKKFRTKNSLKLHVRVHTGEKPYECQYCSWRFHKKGQLVVHIYRHTGERPYVCSVCDRGFKQRGDMRKHKAGHAKQMKKESTG